MCIKTTHNRFTGININWNFIKVNNIKCPDCKFILPKFYKQFERNEVVCIKCRTIYKKN